MEVDFTQYYIIVRHHCEVTSLILTEHGEEQALRVKKRFWDILSLQKERGSALNFVGGPSGFQRQKPRKSSSGASECAPVHKKWCHRILTALQKLVAFGSEKLPGPLLNDIKKKHEEKFPDDTAEFNVGWRLLSGKTSTSESRLLLSKAVTIFHEQLDPILDVKSKLDFIAEMVYGRPINDQEFGGMYCTLLTVNSTVVSAGILRIFGEYMAEIPSVATSSANQGQNMLRG